MFCDKPSVSALNHLISLHSVCFREMSLASYERKQALQSPHLTVVARILGPPYNRTDFMVLVLLKYLVYINKLYISLEREFLIDSNDMLFALNGGHGWLSG